MAPDIPFGDRGRAAGQRRVCSDARRLLSLTLGAEAESLMLNAVNINLVSASAYLDHVNGLGQILAIFVITVAAAEVGLALAIILRLYRNRGTVDVDKVDLMKW